jgi:hypothetical protein
MSKAFLAGCLVAASAATIAQEPPVRVDVLLKGKAVMSFVPAADRSGQGSRGTCSEVSEAGAKTKDGLPIRAFEFTGWKEGEGYRVLMFAIVPAGGPSLQTPCSAGAGFKRVEFANLRLKSEDEVTLSSMKAAGVEPWVIKIGPRKTRFFEAVSLVALHAQSKPAPPAATSGSQRVAVCKLLPTAEVKKHLPWRPQLDQFPPEEEAIGTSGSSCNYPSVMIQVLPGAQRMIDEAKKKGGLEPVSGIGEEAWFHKNPNGYAELYVKAGKYVLTLQSNWDGKDPAVKSGTLSLAKALLAKLQ